MDHCHIGLRHDSKKARVVCFVPFVFAYGLCLIMKTFQLEKLLLQNLGSASLGWGWGGSPIFRTAQYRVMAAPRVPSVNRCMDRGRDEKNGKENTGRIIEEDLQLATLNPGMGNEKMIEKKSA